MENEILPFYKVQYVESGETKYYLRGYSPTIDQNSGEDCPPDTEITKEQYGHLTVLTREAISGDLSEANILRLHQESDPASPLYKGPQPIDGGEPTGDMPIEEQTIPGYYEEPVRSATVEVSPETTGTSVHTTEAATAANAGITSEDLKAEQMTEATIENQAHTDAGTQTESTDASNTQS